ncbi:hypothetical protein CcaCcLH18_09852 [Colletotrichum camelliae]|nr:hypothetical protein CcaCcLH18_09852 [Colletotrichum camelliae]
MASTWLIGLYYLPSDLHLRQRWEYEEVQFDNAFWKPSPYKGKPTPELEAKWKELWYYGSFDLPDSYLPSMNKSSGGIGGDPWARTESGNLLAGLEVFHNLHCLNLVRQYAHKDEYDYSNDPAFHGSPELVLAVSRLDIPCVESAKKSSLYSHQNF